MRTIYSLDLQKDGDMLTLRISGSGFLYNMVRIIAGTLVKVGMGVYPPEHVEEILEARDRAASGPTIPARGLTLVGLEYEKELAPQIAGENRHWSYILNQEEVPGGGPAYLTILRCEESELAGLARRVIHQAYRNGAKEVRIADAGGRAVRTGVCLRDRRTARRALKKAGQNGCWRRMKNMRGEGRYEQNI